MPKYCQMVSTLASDGSCRHGPTWIYRITRIRISHETCSFGNYSTIEGRKNISSWISKSGLFNSQQKRPPKTIRNSKPSGKQSHSWLEYPPIFYEYHWISLFLIGNTYIFKIRAPHFSIATRYVRWSRFLYIKMSMTSTHPCGPASTSPCPTCRPSSTNSSMVVFKVQVSTLSRELVLLMLQKSHSQPPKMVLKACKSWDKRINYLLTGAGFLPSTVPQNSQLWYFKYENYPKDDDMFYYLLCLGGKSCNS